MDKKALLCGVGVAAILVGSGNLNPATAGADGYWSGWYVGAEAGLGGGSFEGVHQAPTYPGDPSPAYPTDISGFIGGINGGYNKRMNSYVVGLEADAMFANIDKITPGGNVSADSSTFTGVANGLDLLASIRARLGYLPNENVMLFGTAGLAYVKAEHTVYGSGSPLSATVKLNDVGFVAGGGVEWAANEVYSFRIQGLYYVFDKRVNTAGLRVGSWNSADYGKINGAFSVRAGLSVNLTNLFSRN